MTDKAIIKNDRDSNFSCIFESFDTPAIPWVESKFSIQFQISETNYKVIEEKIQFLMVFPILYQKSSKEVAISQENVPFNTRSNVIKKLKKKVSM